MIRFLVFIPPALIIAYAIHAGVKYTRMITNIFLGLKYRPVYETVESTVGEKVSILDSAGHEFEAIFVDRPKADKLVIFCHDSGSTKESWEKYAYFLPELGFSVLSLDFSRAENDSEKNTLSQWPIEEDVDRLLLVIRWAKNSLKPGIKIVLFGVSKGANIALAAAIRESSVCGVVTDGLFSMKEIFRDYIRKWAPVLVRPNLFGEKYPYWVVNIFTNLGYWYSQKKSGKKFIDVESLLMQKHPSLCMIHGETDDYISATHQQFLRRITEKEKAQALVIPKAGHNQAVVIDRESYEKTVIGFLKKTIGS